MGARRCALAGEQPLTQIPEEENELRLHPARRRRGHPAVELRLRDHGGLTTSALVAGNTVVLKPASTAALVAARFVELLDEAGVPPGVVNFLPGPGGAIGDALVEHPLTRFVSFTGSREVGLRINELAAKPQPGQKWIKRAILEMGGKDVDRRGRDGGPRRRRDGDRRLGVRLPGAEVLGLLARHRRRRRSTMQVLEKVVERRKQAHGRRHDGSARTTWGR